MFRFVRVIAGADARADVHLEGVQTLYRRVFHFNPLYAEKIAAYAAGRHPEGCESVILAALGPRERVVGFTVTFHFADLKCAYLDYIASDPARAARGIGAALYETMREDMKRRGARRLFLDSLPDDPALLNEPGLLSDAKKRLAFYERLGARPILGTGYERTATRANMGDTNFLLYDPMGADQPLPRALLRKVMARILRAKDGTPADAEAVRALMASVREDPVHIRPPGRKPAPAAAPKQRPRLDIVEITGEPRIDHSPFRGYYERPARVSAIAKGLAAFDLNRWPVRAHGLAAIERVHDRRLVAFLKDAATRIEPGRIVYPELFPLRHPERIPKTFEGQAGYFCMDTSTPITANAFAAARRAVDATLSALDLIESGRTPIAYAAVRPPGHHAERRVFGGFCYFNNAAIAANEASRKGRVATLDIDYHHGNGTQEIFYARADVLSVSIHGHPDSSYPYYAGFADERGEGAGEGFNLNLPLKAPVDDAAYGRTLAEALKRIRRFDPHLLVVSLGVDVMRGDPTGQFDLTAEGLRANGRAIGALGVKTLVVQEGGYHLRNLQAGVAAFLGGLIAGRAAALEKPGAIAQS